MLTYERTGSGEPLVLIHGIGHRRQAWSALVDDLAQDFDVVVVDLPGHGECLDELDPAVPTKDAIETAFRQLFEHLGLERPHVAGNSLGGLIALELGQAGLARSVTALSPAGFWSSRLDFLYVRGLFGSVIGLARLMRPVARPVLATKAGRTAMLGWLHARPGNLTPEQAYGDFTNLLHARPVVNQLFKSAYQFAIHPEGIDVPTTVAWSSRDLVLLPYQARRARAVLSAAEHVTLRGCGHVSMPDDPVLVAETIRRTARLAAAPGVSEAS